MFAFEHAGIEPDILVLSKAIGGSLPLSVVVYREELDCWRPGAHAGTFRGNQMAMAAGSATLRYIRDEGLVEHAGEHGKPAHRTDWVSCGSACRIGDVRPRPDAGDGAGRPGWPHPTGSAARRPTGRWRADCSANACAAA